MWMLEMMIAGEAEDDQSAERASERVVAPREPAHAPG